MTISEAFLESRWTIAFKRSSRIASRGNCQCSFLVRLPSKEYDRFMYRIPMIPKQKNCCQGWTAFPNKLKLNKISQDIVVKLKATTIINSTDKLINKSKLQFRNKLFLWICIIRLREALLLEINNLIQIQYMVTVIIYPDNYFPPVCISERH